MFGHSGQLKTARRHMTIPIFIPHMGCPQACTFCNQNKISGTQAVPFITRTSLEQTIERYLETASESTHIEIGFFGGSFTGLPLTVQNLCLDTAKFYLDSKKIQGIRLSTRPDYIDENICNRLKAYGVTTVELGVQSFSNDVLKACNRGHCAEDTLKAAGHIQRVGIDLGIQLMLGLPKDSLEAWRETVAMTLALKPACVRLYPALVISDTELARAYQSGDYHPLNLEEAVSRAAYAHQLLMKANIPVIRMGLQASEDLRDTNGVLAGPQHDSFRELVESYHYRHMLERDFEQGLPARPIAVRVHPKHVSFFSGNKRSNLVWLEAQGISPLKVVKDDTLPLYTYQWIY